MPKMNLRCGLALEQYEVKRILASSLADVEWNEEPLPQHGDIVDVQQWKIYPFRIAGAMLPQEPVAYGIRTLILQGEETGKILYAVESSADYIRAGRMHYSYLERKTLMAENLAEMQEVVLSEYKRFLSINV